MLQNAFYTDCRSLRVLWQVVVNCELISLNVSRNIHFSSNQSTAHFLPNCKAPQKCWHSATRGGLSTEWIHMVTWRCASLPRDYKDAGVRIGLQAQAGWWSQCCKCSDKGVTDGTENHAGYPSTPLPTTPSTSGISQKNSPEAVTLHCMRQCYCHLCVQKKSQTTTGREDQNCLPEGRGEWKKEWWWKSRCHTCGDSPDDGGLSLLAIHEHCEAVGVLHAGGQPRDDDAARVRDHLPRSLPALAWAHPQLQGTEICSFSHSYQHPDWSSGLTSCQSCNLWSRCPEAPGLHWSLSPKPAPCKQQALCTSPLCAAIFTTQEMSLICPPHHSEARGKNNMGLSSSYLETNPWGRCPGDDNRGLSHFCVERRNRASRLICGVNWPELKSTCCDGSKQFENLTYSSTNSQRYEVSAGLDRFWKSSDLGRI